MKIDCTMSASDDSFTSDLNADKKLGVTFGEYATPFTLIPATQLTLGGVIVGQGLSITETGVLSINTEYVKETLKLDTYVQQDLSILKEADLSNRESQLYIYQDGTPKKTTVSKLVDEKIQTVEDVPDNFIQGNYIFKEIK